MRDDAVYLRYVGILWLPFCLLFRPSPLSPPKKKKKEKKGTPHRDHPLRRVVGPLDLGPAGAAGAAPVLEIVPIPEPEPYPEPVFEPVLVLVLVLGAAPSFRGSFLISPSSVAWDAVAGLFQ